MQIIPSIDLHRGQAVKLVGGVPGSEVYSNPSPLNLLEEWQSQGAERIHVVDLDSALGVPSEENKRTIGELLSSARAKIQIGGGIRSSSDASRYLDMGADAVVVSTIIFSDRRMFEQLVNSFPGRVVASIDFRGTSVSISGWTTEYPVLPEVAAAECDYLPLHSLIATDVSVEGRLTGIDIAGVRRIRKVVKHPLIVAGGVSGVDDLMALRRCGADGAILGRILYGQRSSFMKLVEGFRNKM